MQMKTCKKEYLVQWVAVCLAIVLGVGLYSGLPVSATQSRKQNFSTDYTLTGDGAQDILNVALAQQGKTGSELGYTEEWCADFVSDCADLAGQSEAVPRYGGVDGLKKKILTAGGVVVTSPQPGDIVFFSGHVEIVYSGSGSSLKSIGGNTSSAGSLYSRKVSSPRVHGGSYTVVRPNYKKVNPNPPTTATLSKNQVWYDIKDTITLTVSADNATNYFLSIINKDGDSIVQGIEIPGTYSISAADLGYGDYHAWASVANSAGGVDTNGVDFSVVGAATYSDVQTSKSMYSLDDTVTISVNTICAKGQVIGIDKNDTTRVITEQCDSTYQISASQLGAGSYSAYFSVYNGSGGVDTKRVNFYIYNPEDLGTNFYAYIINTGAWKMLSNESDNNVVMHDETGHSEQVWKFTRNSDNSYSIINCKTGRALDSGGIDDNVYTYDDCGNDYQNWYICGESGAYYLKSKSSDKVIDMVNGSVDDGTNAHMYDWNGTTAQKFQIWKLDYTPVLFGDLNADNTISPDDIVLLQQYLSGKLTLTQDQWQAADINEDGVVNAFDLVLLRQKLLA